MKFLIVTIAIAAMAQMCMAGPMIRYKRSEAFVQVFSDAIRTIQTFSPRAETIFRNCLKDIPKTPAYSQYIRLFEEYLNDMKELKSSTGNCFEKSVVGLERMVQFAEAVDAVDPEKRTREGQQMDTILTNNGGDQFADDLKSFSDKFENLNLENELENITANDAIRIAPMITQVC